MAELEDRSVAARVGFQKGDQIVAINGQRVVSHEGCRAPLPQRGAAIGKSRSIAAGGCSRRSWVAEGLAHQSRARCPRTGTSVHALDRRGELLGEGRATGGLRPRARFTRSALPCRTRGISCAASRGWSPTGRRSPISADVYVDPQARGQRSRQGPHRGGHGASRPAKSSGASCSQPATRTGFMHNTGSSRSRSPSG